MLITPLFPILCPVVYWFRRKQKEEKLKESEKFSSPTVEQEERDNIISEVCERFKLDCTVDNSDVECRQRKILSREHDNDNFNERVRKLRKQKSFHIKTLRFKNERNDR